MHTNDAGPLHHNYMLEFIFEQQNIFQQIVC